LGKGWARTKSFGFRKERSVRFWERQPQETSKAYEAFQLYRDMGLGRSTARVARELGKSKTLMDRWSSRHDWVGRVQALEDWKEMIRRDALEEREREQAHDFAERQQKLRWKLLENGEKAAEQEALMLSWPLQEELVERRNEKGEPVLYRLIPANWHKGTIKQLHDVASRVAGESDRLSVDHQYYDLREATDEQLRRIVDGEDPASVLGN
jgi:hypothetical protein